MKYLGLTAIVWLTLFLACGTSTDDTDDTSTEDYVSATSEIGDLSGSGSTGLSLVSSPRKDSSGACSSVPFGACEGKKRERAFSLAGGDTEPCTRGKANGRRVFGKVLLTYSADSCAFSAEDSTITRTLSNHYVQRGLNGKKVLIYTDSGTVASKSLSESDLIDYEGTKRSGGAIKKKGSGTEDKLTILGIHRRGLNPNGKFGFWHTLWSEADAITVVESGTGDSSTATLNGTFYIMHNRAKLKVTKTLKDIKFVKGCSHPTSGTETITLPNGTTTSVTFNSNCGLPTIDSAESTLDPET